MESATEDMSGDVDQEADDTYKQVLDEVGLDIVGGQAVPSAKVKSGVSGKTEAKSDMDDLEKKLADLKN